MEDNAFERGPGHALGERLLFSPAQEQSLDLMKDESRTKQSTSQRSRENSAEQSEPTQLAFDAEDIYATSTAGGARPSFTAPRKDAGRDGKDASKDAKDGDRNGKDFEVVKELGKDLKPNPGCNLDYGGKLAQSDLRLSLKARSTVPQQLQGQRLATQVDGFFSQIDADDNGILEADELGRAVEDHQYVGFNAQAVAALYQNRTSLAQLSDDQPFWEVGITRADLTTLSDATPRLGEMTREQQQGMTALAGVNGTIWRTAEGQRVGSDQLYGRSGEPSPLAIDQGTIGDCYFLASISALANTSPERIQNMIHDNRNGTYTVTFPGDPHHPITVDAPTEAEGGIFQQATSNGIWANVLETAFGEYRQQRRDRRQGFTSTEGADGGGLPRDVITLLTGVAAADMRVDENVIQLVQARTALSRAFEQDLAVTAATISRESASVDGVERTPDGYVRQHAYAIIDWNPEGPGGGTITLRNPWGSEGEGRNGVSQLSLLQFQRNFRTLTVESRPTRPWFVMS